ncbi:MAG: carbonic anhydrase, partial [Gemmataceae bacterium]
MRKIIQGVRLFQETVFKKNKELFEALAEKQQSPRALFITCSDSRINPNLITSTEPGDLFLLRNAGNIIPPYGAASGGEGATIEYAVSVLKMKNIIVCGHYHCGAMHYLLRKEQTEDLPAVRRWFSHAEATRQIVKTRYGTLPIRDQENLIIEENVLVQIDNLRTHPAVASGLVSGELCVFGWTYRIETGEVLAYDPIEDKFSPILSSSPGAPHSNSHRTRGHRL